MKEGTSMDQAVLDARSQDQQLTDEQVVERVLAGETSLFEVIMRRYNQRLYRAARAITRSDSEAEDVLQDAYVRAFQHLRQYQGRAAFGAWLTRIAVNEAIARLRQSKRFEPFEDSEGEVPHMSSPERSPEQSAADSETCALLEQAVERLPDNYRIVYMLREVEELGTAETAQVLEATEENVKVRLHRARALLRKQLYATVGKNAREAFTFHAVRCDRVVRNVFARLQQLAITTPHQI
jgi:RNA polymerase sigma-70 factor (ECF subfamily)